MCVFHIFSSICYVYVIIVSVSFCLCYFYQRPLYQPGIAVIISVQVRLKTRPWAGRPVFPPEAVGHERVRLQRTSRWLTQMDASFKSKLEPKLSQVL